MAQSWNDMILSIPIKYKNFIATIIATTEIWILKEVTLVQMKFWPVDHWSSQKVKKKVFNWSEVHLYQSNFFQNPYIF